MPPRGWQRGARSKGYTQTIGTDAEATTIIDVFIAQPHSSLGRWDEYLERLRVLNPAPSDVLQRIHRFLSQYLHLCLILRKVHENVLATLIEIALLVILAAPLAAAVLT